jgi:ATP-binding cassette, subfamily C, bacterial CydD
MLNCPNNTLFTEFIFSLVMIYLFPLKPLTNTVQPTESENQVYFDNNKNREKVCAAWLKQQSKAVRKSLLLTASAGIFNGLLVIAQAALLAFILHAVIIDKVVLTSIMPWLAALIGIFLLRGVCLYAYQVFGFEAGAQVKSSVRQQLLDSFLNLGPSEIKHHQSGELTSVTLEQVEALENYFSRYLPQQMIVGILPIIMIMVVMPVNWVVGLIFLLTGPLVPVFMALVGMGAASANRNQFLAMKRMSGYFLDRLQGLATLKLFGQATAELNNINLMAEHFREKTMAVLKIAFLSSAVLEFFSAVAVALIAVYVGLGLLGEIHFGPAEHINLRNALFVLLLAPEFFMPLKQLAINYHDRAAALGATDAILALIEQETILLDKKRVTLPLDNKQCIAFKNVSKAYEQRMVLTSINLVMTQREKIALIGESGAGKTTLLNLLLGFESPSEGQVFINGVEVTQENTAKLIAWVGQNAYIFHGTIKDNITLANPEATEQRISEAAQASGITEFSQALPEGLLTLVGERGYGLSGGQVQRIALARAFLKEADIIVLDEPTANLDSTNKVLLLDVIADLFRDKTLIIATHDPVVINRMTRHIVLQQGRLVS